MATLPKVLLWTRTDLPGAETVVFDDRRGLVARGTQQAVDPIPYLARYELIVDENWQTARLDVSVEGAGWMRLSGCSGPPAVARHHRRAG